MLPWKVEILMLSLTFHLNEFIQEIIRIKRHDLFFAEDSKKQYSWEIKTTSTLTGRTIVLYTVTLKSIQLKLFWIELIKPICDFWLNVYIQRSVIKIDGRCNSLFHHVLLNYVLNTFFVICFLGADRKSICCLNKPDVF